LSNNSNIDFENNQKIALEKLYDCQKKQNLVSCMPCSRFLDCSTRNEFVKATYSKMNKGDKGGFEF